MCSLPGILLIESNAASGILLLAVLGPHANFVDKFVPHRYRYAALILLYRRREFNIYIIVSLKVHIYDASLVNL